MKFAVIVVGGGHAGVEAALAAARMGQPTLLLTMSLDALGALSCNPSIGGLGKSHLVREVDALGGFIGTAADSSCIHRRVLNRSRGPAVWATRCQIDRPSYMQLTKTTVQLQPNLYLLQGECTGLLMSGHRVGGVVTSHGQEISSQSVVLTTGTFLGGVMHIGTVQRAGGRQGEVASTLLAAQIRDLGLPVGRLKTGTPPRLDGRTIDYAQLEEQPARAAWSRRRAFAVVRQRRTASRAALVPYHAHEPRSARHHPREHPSLADAHGCYFWKRTALLSFHRG